MDLREWERTGDVSGTGQSIGEGCGLGTAGRYPTTSVLGLTWDRELDVLKLSFKIEDVEEKITKRKILSSVHKIFDPVGFSSPTTLLPKVLLQNLWSVKLGWDEEVPTEVAAKFIKWMQELKYLLQINIPRQIFTAKEAVGIQFHMFGDASKSAYAAVVFIRNVEEGQVSIHLAQAKSRVSPLKKGTIPRLELLACLIGARLAKSVKEALGMEEVPVTYWSDSTTALAWIRRNNAWGTFVGNRVREILSHTNSEDWKYVPGLLNPADLPSRGCSSLQLLNSKWWEGPQWLKLPQSEWPRGEEEVDEKLVDIELKKSTLVLAATELPKIFNPPFSSYFKNVRVFGWVHRFISNSKPSSIRETSSNLTLTEIKQAENYLLRVVQMESFLMDAKRIAGISVCSKDDGLLHVQSRLLNGDEDYYFKWPILLPKSHPIVDQLIESVHRMHGHIGIQCLLGKLRQRFWILQGRLTVKKVIRKCVACRRHEAKPFDVDPASLPDKRVRIGHAFQTTGVDLAGPLYLRNGKKTWVVLYTCAVFRCVHLDLVLSLTTDAFLGSLERFICLFGRPSTIYSDNGTNFKGAENLFRKLDWKRIEDKCHILRIQWIFNPPTTAWWGRWWERLVSSFKNLLRRMLGRASLDEERLRTCLCTAAASINSRPLTTVTEDQDDLLSLTPAMFLRGPIVTQFPESTEISDRDLQADYKRTAVLRKELESRFRKEYLSLLIQRAKEKKTPPPKLGDIVMVGADNRKRIDWPIGRIISLHPGKDGKVRVASVKTSKGVLTRPLQRLYSLEVTQSPLLQEVSIQPDQRKVKSKEPITQNFPAQSGTVPVVKTRAGREVKKPDRFQ